MVERALHLQASTGVLAAMVAGAVASPALAQFTPTERHGYLHLYTSYQDHLREYSLADGGLYVSADINSPGQNCRPRAVAGGSLQSTIAPGYLILGAGGSVQMYPLAACGLSQAAGAQASDEVLFTVSQPAQ